MSYTNPFERPEQPTYFVPVVEYGEEDSEAPATPADALESSPAPAPTPPPAPPRNTTGNTRVPRRSGVNEVDPSALPDSAVAQNQERADNILSFQVSKAAIAKEYDAIIGQLRDQYQFAETPEEKARLKYMLADIELEFDAANQSIEEVYELRQQNVSAMGPDILARSQAEGQRAGSYFTDLASSMEQEAVSIENQIGNEFAGLGLEEVAQVENEWVSLIRSFAPIQQSYIEDQGRQTINDLARINASMEMQSASQLAQLQRMRAGTINTAQYRHMQQVEQRIESEKQDARARITSIMLEKLARLQSAAEFNAGLALRADEALANATNPDEFYGGLVNYAYTMGRGDTNPDAFLDGFITRSGGVQPDAFMWSTWLGQALPRQAANLDASLNHQRSLERERNEAAQTALAWVSPEDGSTISPFGEGYLEELDEQLATAREAYDRDLALYQRLEGMYNSVNNQLATSNR